MKYLLAMALCLSSVQLVHAEKLLETYSTQIGSWDHYSSKGSKLKDAASIIRQDRANFHKFDKADPQDDMDSFFSNANNRAKIAEMLRKGSTTKSTMNEIMNGTPTIVVYRYKSKIDVEVE